MATGRSTLDVISGEARVYKLLAGPGAIVIAAAACRTTGFVPDTSTEYRNPSVYREGGCRTARLPSELSWGNNWPGRFYIGVVMQDSAAGDEPLELWVGDRTVGAGSARENDNRVHLLVASEPVVLRGGETIQVRCEPNAMPYRIESLVLLRRKPAPTPRALSFRDLAARVVLGPDGAGEVVVTWTTSRPSTAEVVLRRRGRRVGAYQVEAPMQNNRVAVPLQGSAEGLEVEVLALSADRTLSADATCTVAGPPNTANEGAKPRAVELLVENAGATPLGDWPVTGGVPVPRGVLTDPDEVSVTSGEGLALPCQTRTLSVWPDGSIRWLLVDTQVDVPAHGTVRLRVGLGERGEVPAVPEPVAIRVDGARAQISTGAAQLCLDADALVVPGALGLPGQAPLLGGPGPGGIVVVDAAGRRYSTESARAQITVEETGPLRAVLRADVPHFDSRGEKLFSSVVRIHAFAGKPWVRVLHTFVNDNVSDTFTTIRELHLATPRAAGTAGAPSRALQHHDNAYAVTGEDGSVISSGRHHGGTLEVAAPDGCALIAVRHFSENYPKSLSVGPEGVTVGICPDVRHVSYDRDGYEADRLYYYLTPEGYRFKCGVSRTHELFYGIAPEGSCAALRRDARGFQSPPAVRPATEAVLRSGVLEGLAARDDERLAAYEGYVAKSLEGYLQDRAETRAWGMLNFGDWFGERRYNWGNMEYDTPWAWLMEFLRGGDARCFALGEQAAWHLVDVDTCHAAADAGRTGGQYAHCVGHVGGYYPQGFREMATADGYMGCSHMWVEGLFLYYALTGHEHIREWAEATCRHLNGALLNDYDFSNCREPGWLLIHLMAAYNATADPWYQNGARIVVERVLERQRRSGGWERLMVPGHCYCDPPRHMGNATFMVGVLMAGLKRYHLATGDRRVRRCIIDAARYLVRENYVAQDKVFRYTNCPYIWQDTEMNAQMHEGLAYASHLSGDPKLCRVLVDALRRDFSPSQRRDEDGVLFVRVPGAPERRFVVEDEGLGKHVTMRMRQAPMALGQVLRLGETLE